MPVTLSMALPLWFRSKLRQRAFRQRLLQWLPLVELWVRRWPGWTKAVLEGWANWSTTRRRGRVAVNVGARDGRRWAALAVNLLLTQRALRVGARSAGCATRGLRLTASTTR